MTTPLDAEAGSLQARHRTLRDRPRCGATWKPKQTEPDHPQHRCQAFVGHLGPHTCHCGGASTKGQEATLGRMGKR